MAVNPRSYGFKGMFEDKPKVGEGGLVSDVRTKAELRQLVGDLQVKLDAEHEKIANYREGMEAMRKLLLSALGVEDVPAFYEDKSNTDLAAECALMIRKTAEQAFGGVDRIHGAAPAITVKLIMEHLDDTDYDETTACDLTELALEMQVRGKGDTVANLGLREKVDELVPTLRELGYLQERRFGLGVPREKTIEAVKSFIRRRVKSKERESQATSGGEPLPWDVEESLQAELERKQGRERRALSRPVPGSKTALPPKSGKCPSCDGTGMGDYPWECNTCGGDGKAR